MTSINFLLLSLYFYFLTSCISNKETKFIDDRPNIIVILADDLGFSDVGCYGGEIATENIDYLAQNGLRFNAFYNAARCCPTRASLLTGLYPHEAGIGRMTKNQNAPGYRGEINRSSTTIAEMLKKEGYQTGMVGKWHVSETIPLEKEEQLRWLSHTKYQDKFAALESYPTNRGFDKFYGNIWGVVDYFDPFSLVNDLEPVKEVPNDFYYTNAIGDSAVAYVNEFSKIEKPFFLYVAHTAPHWPLQAPKETIKKYDSLYNQGWEETRRKRYHKLIEEGIIKGETALLSEFLFPEKKWEENPHKRWDQKAMATHAAMVDIMDKTIGDLINALDHNGELDNTVIFFLSDNGASYERPSKYGPGFDRAGSTRDGRTVHFPVRKDSLPGSQTVHSGIGPIWANVSNTPFKYWKSKNHEGGIASPLIVHWPKGIKEKGEIIEQMTHVIDITPTCLSLAKGKKASQSTNEKAFSFSGKDFSPLFQIENKDSIHDVLFWEHLGAAALRKGKFKIVKKKKNEDWELYDMSQDRTETKNLANKHPEIVKSMSEKWLEMAKELKVYPLPKIK